MSILQEIGNKAVTGIIGALTIGTGSLVLNNTITNARQDEQVVTITKMQDKLERMHDDITQIRVEVSKMQGQNEGKI